MKTKGFCQLFLSIVFAFIYANAQAQFFGNKAPKLLPEGEAFSVSAQILEGGQLNVSWVIAEDYYMYRDQFKIIKNDSEIQASNMQFQQGVTENDPEFGEVEVYFYNANFTTQLNTLTQTESVTLELHGQGCNKPVGVCYPPMKRKISVDVTTQELNGASALSSLVNEPTKAVSKEKSFVAYLLAAFGAGILLSFTPCVLPMIPILAGVIGQHKKQGGLLAIFYVLGTIITYMIAGAVAGATGAQLQAYFQTPLFIGVICSLLILLALSLFGVFKIQLPSSLQTKLQNTQLNNSSAMLRSFGLGLISALIVGACVSPVLILALGAAITQGDPVLGVGIMGSMALGMGLLLIAFGFGASWLLPKTGDWMNQIQILFGFMVLTVVIYLLSIFPSIPVLAIWAAWLFTFGFYLWHIAQETVSTLTKSVFKMFALISIVWGTLAIIGQATGGNDVLNPLENITRLTQQNDSNAPERLLPIISVTTLPDALDLLEQAKQKQQPTLIDFYADWCLDCRRMHKTTFREQNVHDALANWQLIEIDVTENSEDSKLAKKHFEVFGPPATLFYTDDGNEKTELRQYGYLNTQQLLALIQQTEN